MALPVTITGISTVVSTVGPFKSSAGNYYFFGRDGTTATTLQAFKATAPDTSWASITTKTGFTTAILGLAGYQVGDVIHLAVTDGTSTTAVATKYLSFNMSNDTFLATIETISAAVSIISTAASPSIVVRSNGEVVALYVGVSTKTTGTNYSRIYYRRRTAVNTWGTETEVDPSTALNCTGPVAVLGAADRVHFAFTAGANTGYRTLSAANALNTYASSASMAAPGDAVSYVRSATTKVVFTNTGGGQITMRFDSADNPTPTFTNQSIAAADTPHRIGVDGTDVTVGYRNTSDSDLYAIKSTDDGATFGSPGSLFVGTVASADANLSRNSTGGMYQRGASIVVGYVVNDNGTLKYNELVTRTGVAVTASGLGAAAATGIAIKLITGAAVGTGGGTAKGIAIISATGAAVGSGAGAGVGQTIVAAQPRAAVSWVELSGAQALVTGGITAAVGTAVGVGAAAATGLGIATGIVNAVGTGTAAATGTAIKLATSSTAAGVGSAAATGLGMAAGFGVGVAAGAGVATATGACTAASAGVGAGAGAATATGSSIAASGGGIIRPNSDITLDGWTDQAGGTTNIYASIADTDGVSDADYIQSPAIAATGITNIVLQSEAMDVSPWLIGGTTGGTITANVITAPDGAMTADMVTDAVGSNVYGPLQITSVPANTNHTYSVYAKAGTISWLQFHTTSSININFDLINGVVGKVSAGATAQIISVGGGWYRCIATYSNPNPSAPFFLLLAPNDITDVAIYTGTGTGTLYLWGAQVQLGTVATEYIPTTTVPVTVVGVSDLKVRLFESSTQIAEWTHSDVAETYTDAVQTLTAPQLASISNFNNLEVELDDNQSNVYRCAIGNPSGPLTAPVNVRYRYKKLIA